MVKMAIKEVKGPLVLQDHLECQDQGETLGCKVALVPGGRRASLALLGDMD